MQSREWRERRDWQFQDEHPIVFGEPRHDLLRSPPMVIPGSRQNAKYIVASDQGKIHSAVFVRNFLLQGYQSCWGAFCRNSRNWVCTKKPGWEKSLGATRNAVIRKN